MPSDYSPQEARNREIVLDFYEKAIRRWDFDAAAIHLGDQYIQHTPTVADGVDGLRAFIENVPPPVKEHLRTEIRRVLVDGDLVAIHTLNTMAGVARVIVDIFRVEDGKVVEHWDVVQDMPAESLHQNPMA